MTRAPGPGTLAGMRFVIAVVALLIAYGSKNWAAGIIGGLVTGVLFGGWWYGFRLGEYDRRERTRRVRAWPGR